jgi:hypothetical protein
VLLLKEMRWRETRRGDGGRGYTPPQDEKSAEVIDRKRVERAGGKECAIL